MIRVIQRHLIIPRGDTGIFTIPALNNVSQSAIAVFTIFDPLTRTKIFEKQVAVVEEQLNIEFTHLETVNLVPGKYLWDIKFYINPEFVDGKLINGTEVNSYYAGFTLPVCEIRETGDNLFTNDAGEALTPANLDVIAAALNQLQAAVAQTEENVKRYPKIVDDYWYTWDAELGDYTNTGTRAVPDTSEFVRFDDLQAITNEEIDMITGGV